jgi:hypothetical protein
VRLRAVLEEAHRETKKMEGELAEALREAGWNMDRVKVEAVHARASW